MKNINRKKAEEIAKAVIPDFLCEEGGLGVEKLAQDSCAEAALMMAEWKDDEFMKYLKKKQADESFIGGCASYQHARRQLIDEIIAEVSKKFGKKSK